MRHGLFLEPLGRPRFLGGGVGRACCCSAGFRGLGTTVVVAPVLLALACSGEDDDVLVVICCCKDKWYFTRSYSTNLQSES